MAYIPPITIYEDIANQITEFRDNQIYTQVRMQVDVDKEELLKALAYDRQQYEKGFEDAKAQFDRPKAHRLMLPKHGIYVCDNCKRMIYNESSNFCWCCGNEFIQPNKVDVDEV